MEQRDNKHRERERIDAHARRTHRERRYLFRRPRPLQYFRGGVLIRDTTERTSQRLELFFDLTFVGLISVLAKECVRHPDGAGLAKYILTFLPAFMVWTYVREIMDSFWNDDLQQRMLILVVMAALVVYGNNATSVEQDRSEGPGRSTAVAAYLVATGTVGGVFLWYSFFVKAWRIQVRAHWVFAAVFMGLWIASIFVNVHQAAAIASVAICLEYCAWLYVYSPAFKNLMHLQYSSALSIEHELDRFNDFFTLVMGEFLFSSISGQPAGLGVHEGVGRAVLSLVIAFSFQLLYIGGSGCKKILHPIRKSAASAIAWLNLHIPLVMSLTLVGDASAELVSENVDVESGVRWIFCGGYTVAMLSLWALAYIDTSRDEPGEVWFPKDARIGGRLVSAIIVVFLPLTSQETLSSNKLLGIIAALSFGTFLWESVSSLDGPNGPAYQPRDEGSSPGMSTPPNAVAADPGKRAEMWAATLQWRGYPCFAEPGLYVPDRTHQRQLEPTTSNDDTEKQLVE
ncbi:hypothetical protein DL93DRAFT_2058046 [Clavulina sp. PMI_390]|nr:hypothetical protein DL93DRAFT_2058046 [Clavulina sp. PMI_390]